MTTSVLDTRTIKDPLVLWSSGFGLGFLPKAPGTWGALGAALFWWFVLADLGWLTQVIVIALYFVPSWWAAEQIAVKYQIQDASAIVTDEVLGMWLALLFAPRVWWVVAIAFVLFRMLDIWKPGPIGWLDKELKGGLGVIMDDMLAGAIVAVLIGVIWFSFSIS